MNRKTSKFPFQRWFDTWKGAARLLKLETYALYFAYQDPRVPWYAKFLALLTVGYAFSPIDLIPDFIPVLGYIDDLILIPLGVALVVRLIPEQVMDECRQKAQEHENKDKPRSYLVAATIILIWLLLGGVFIHRLISIFAK
jgi:uncharacterized membrane protein YkvA (DUF1232 family)